MFDLPGFDVKAMSDEQLLDRAEQLSAKIAWASRYGGSGTAVDMMMRMSDAINAERSERAFMARWEKIAPIVSRPIESDPDMQDGGNVATNGKEIIPRKRIRNGITRRPGPIPTPTPTPTPGTTPPDGDEPEKGDTK